MDLEHRTAEVPDGIHELHQGLVADRAVTN